MDLKGKCVLLGVSGGIAAYKMANVASALRKLGADVEVPLSLNLIGIKKAFLSRSNILFPQISIKKADKSLF